MKSSKQEKLSQNNNHNYIETQDNSNTKERTRDLGK